MASGFRALRDAVSRQYGTSFRGVVEESTAKALNKLLVQHGVVFELDEFVVKGRVTDSHGQPRLGLKVVAFDRDLRRHQRLNDASTDSEGFYSISFQADAFRRGDAMAPLGPDLFVAVLPVNGVEPLAISEIRYNANTVETIDLVVESLEKGFSEFERIGALVMPLLQGQGTPLVVLNVVADPVPTDLLPHELNTADIEFIVRETGLDAIAVQDWATAARLWNDARALQPKDASAADSSALQAHGWPFFFGWCRAGLTSELVGVLSAAPDQWAMSMRVAQTRGWVPSAFENEASALPGALERLSEVASLDPMYAGDPLFAEVTLVAGETRRLA